MIRRSFIGLNHRANSAAAELRKSLPLFGRVFPDYVGLSVAALSSVTTHLPADLDSSLHSAECPVILRRLPLSRITEEPCFTSNPCPVCLRQRLNYLASVVFCHDFEQRCEKSESADVPKPLLDVVEMQFGSLFSLTEELKSFVTSSTAPGRVWVVNDGEHIRIIKLPTNNVPLAFGLWPLFVVNATEERLCAALARSIASDTSHGDVSPSWSRASRGNKNVRSPKMGLTCGSLSEARALLAQHAIDVANWPFVNDQLFKARRYFLSSERRAAREKHRMKMEDDAAVQVLSHLKDFSGAEKSFSIVNRVHESQKGANIATADLPGENHVGAEPDVSEAAGDDPQAVQHDDGSWEYRYKSGDVTFIYADGSKLFKTSNLTTTVGSDGRTLYEYSNNSSILDYPDGRRVITFPDGSTKEEQRAL